MSDNSSIEAVWTLSQGTLGSEEVVSNLFMAIGEIRPVEPVRYDLNRRDRWRDYDGRRLIVDVLTQRTQLVTITEEKSVDEGGTLVVIGAGKQDEPPQGVAQWRDSWPPPKQTVDRWKQAVMQAFSDLPLDSFVLRVDRQREGQQVVMGATKDTSTKRAIERRVGARGESFVTGAVEGRSFIGDRFDSPPEEWNELWHGQSR